MTRKLTALVLALAVGTAAAGCGGDDGDDASGASATTGAPTASSMAVAAGGRLELADTALGRVLVDDAGMVLYLFTDDAQGESTCYDACEEAWPVVGELAGVGEGLDASLLGTTTRSDGTVQATYNGWPLYHYAADGAPGEANGQGIRDVWFVVDAAGEAVGASATAASTTAFSPGY